MDSVAKSYIIDPGTCPSCGVSQNMTASVEKNGRPPRADDISICSECAALSIFIDDLGRMRKPTWVDIERFKQAGIWAKICDAQRKSRFEWHKRNPGSGPLGRRKRVQYNGQIY